MTNNEPKGTDDLQQAALDALENVKEKAATREKEKEDQGKAKEKRKTIRIALQLLLLLASIVVIIFQAPSLISSISRESKPLRHGTFETDKLTDACIQNLWKVSALLQQGKLPDKKLLCPASQKPFNITETDGDIVASSPNPELYGFKAIRVSKRKPVPELIK